MDSKWNRGKADQLRHRDKFGKLGAITCPQLTLRNRDRTLLEAKKKKPKKQNMTNSGCLWTKSLPYILKPPNLIWVPGLKTIRQLGLKTKRQDLQDRGPEAPIVTWNETQLRVLHQWKTKGSTYIFSQRNKGISRSRLFSACLPLGRSSRGDNRDSQSPDFSHWCSVQ